VEDRRPSPTYRRECKGTCVTQGLAASASPAARGQLNANLKVEISLSVDLDGQLALPLETELRQALQDLDVLQQVRVESS
jgi:hypothetical protein